VHKDDGAEGDENIFAKEQADVVRRRRHRAQAIANAGKRT
jgi:hypothetical protein